MKVNIHGSESDDAFMMISAALFAFQSWWKGNYTTDRAIINMIQFRHDNRI